MSKNGDLKNLLKRLEAQGFVVVPTKSGYMVREPKPGTGIVTIHKTESDTGVKKITEGRLRRIGFKTE